MQEKLDYVAEYDKLKTKVLKYIMYKKRTENEIRQKFSLSIEEDMLDDIIEELKETGYIDDESYIQRAVKEFMNLKNLSVKEIKYKLLAKGLSSDIIEEYISNHIEELTDYELQAIKNIFYKKQTNSELDEIKQYLLKKGYLSDNIKEALSEVE